MQSPDRTNYLPGDAHQRFEVLTANNIEDFNHNNNNMQIIAVGVTNRRDQQKALFIAFVVPCGQP